MIVFCAAGDGMELVVDSVLDKYRAALRQAHEICFSVT